MAIIRMPLWCALKGKKLIEELSKSWKKLYDRRIRATKQTGSDELLCHHERSKSPIMQVLIVDDHTIIRRGIKNMLLEHYPQVELVDVNSLAAARKALSTRRFCVVILDLILGDGNAFERVAEWTHQYSQTRFLIYSMVPENLYAERVMALGCAGFVSKDGPEVELLDALERLRMGGTYMSEALQEARRKKDPKAASDPFLVLSNRELGVMQELLSGFGIKEISQRMDISPSTVATYKARLMDKLGVTSMTELHRLAEIHGIKDR